MKKKVLNIFFGLMFIAGLCIFFYPIVSNLIVQYKQEQVISDYREAVSTMSNETYEQEMADAKAYNNLISHYPTVSQAFIAQVSSPKKYEDLLNVGGVDVMGVLEIPAVDIKLPIYHGTDESRLQVGIGHYQGSSLPIGGKSTHSVLTGHRGLPSSKLLSDIDHLKIGDMFYITVLHNTVAYKVDQIKTVLPDELADIGVTEGKDYCTLVTCTPYGINTHRLLVRGHRVPFKETSDDVKDDVYTLSFPFALVIALILYGIVMMIKNLKKKKGEKQ